jgi:membrane protease YdiL (CAAX protease family)
MTTGRSWRGLADEALLVAMPSTGRIALEITLLLGLMFGASALPESAPLTILALALVLALALSLVRPWRPSESGMVGKSLATGLVVLAVLAPAFVEHPTLGDPSRRLGVGVTPAAKAPQGPQAPGGVVVVDTVVKGSPADGTLREGDAVSALGGKPLDRADPVQDLTTRTHGDELAEDTTVTVLRDGAWQDLPVHIPRVHPRAANFGRAIRAVRLLASRHILVAAAVRDALIIGLLLLLVRRDGQPLSALGLVGQGAMRELGAAAWMTAGTFAVQIVAAVPIGLLGLAMGILEHEGEQRTAALGTLSVQASGVEFAVAFAIAATFEELAFRAFLMPRVRAMTGSWAVAIGLVSVVFGLGHVYEGLLAVVQTAILGIYFSAMFLLRRRLLGPAVAHAAFDTVMLLVVRAVAASGLVESLRHLAPK